MVVKNRTHITSSEAYLAAIKDVLYNPEFISAPRGLPIREITNYSFTITEPTVDPIITHDEKRNEIIKDYSEKEFAIYQKGTNLVEDFEKISKFWKKLANPDGKTINSAYGHLVFFNKSHGDPEFECAKVSSEAYNAEDFGILNVWEVCDTINACRESAMRTPWEWVVASLKADKDSRQAFARFSLPTHQWVGNRDQTCTMHANFLIRNDEIHATVVMRSNDLMLGLVFDLCWFIALMYRLQIDLKDVYPNLKIGTYTHIAHSMHIYEKDIPAMKKMLGES